MARPDRHPQAPCGPSCTYRRLYEGGQLSLADMAARQAEALTRVSRVRNGIVQALRHADPERFAAIERELGRRLSEADDDVVLRVLDAWTARPTDRRPAPAATSVEMAALRAVLVELGLPLPAGDDPVRWAEALRAHRAAAPAAGSPPGRQGRDATVQPSPPPAATPARVAAETLGDLFGDEPTVNAGDTLGDLFGDEPTVNAGDTLGDLFGDDGQPGDGPFDDSPFDDSPFDDSPFDDSPFVEAGEATPDGEGPGSALDAAVDLLDESFGDLGPLGSETPAPPAATPLPTLPPAPLRPTLPGGRDVKKRTGGKAARVSAVRPDLSDGDGDPEATAELPGEKADALLAAVSVGRPVFLDDLRAVVADEEVLATWERTMRSDATAPVRFFPAKSRHRALGPLVVPRDYLKEIAGGARGWWPECVERYRGNRLYELGVLLRKVGSSVVAHRLGEHTVVLRGNDARGLSGMVVVLDPELGDGQPARAEVVAAVEELLRERLTLIAVLAAVETAVAPLEELLREEADVRGWAPTMPVALDRSWRWGEPGTANVVLGG